MQNHITTNMPDEQRLPMGKLAVGIGLLAIGILGFTDAIDIWEPDELWRFWPLILIFVGVANEADALVRRRGSGGYVLIAIGTWLLIGNNEYFGLDHGSAIPVAIAIVGLGLITHALIGVQKANKS
ncbi:MAG TPA: DUF5668 domain-containing protein [Thermoanaerobaculia bacterium]